MCPSISIRSCRAGNFFGNTVINCFMNTNHSIFPRQFPVPLPSAGELSLPSFERLIVIIPTENDLRQTLRWLRKSTRALPARILLLGVNATGLDEGVTQEQLEILALDLKNESRVVATRIANGPRWLSKVEQIVREGDLLILFENGTANHETRTMVQEIKNRLRVPVLAIPNQHDSWFKRSKFRSQLVLWLGALGIVFGFLAIQLKLMQTPNNWTQTVLLCASVITEFFLLSCWNALFVIGSLG